MSPISVIAIRLLLAGTVLLLGIHPVSAGRLGPGYYPNVPLVNQDGETLYFYDDVIKGKVVSINFMFTSCPDSCPLETAKLREVQKRLGEHVGKDVFMYSITVDPERDTPAVLKAYMEKFEVARGWQFLTGKKEDIDLIRRKLAMYNEDEDELSDHAINFIMGNEATGQWVKRTPFDVPQSLVAVLLGRLQKGSLISSQAQPSYATATRLPTARTGEDLFVTRCTACHTIGQGDKLGPDLLGVTSKRDRLWLIRWLQAPDVMLKERDPIALALYAQYNNVAMPNVKLTGADILALIEYLQEETRRVNAMAAGARPQSDNLKTPLQAKPTPGASATTAPGNTPLEDQARAELAPVNDVQ